MALKRKTTFNDYLLQTAIAITLNDDLRRKRIGLQAFNHHFAANKGFAQSLHAAAVRFPVSSQFRIQSHACFNNNFV